MNRLSSSCLRSIVTLLLCGAASLSQAADWPKLLDHPPAGANTIALVNVDAMRYGAAKLKTFKEGEQQAAAADLVAELPEGSKRAAIAAKLDFDSLEPLWELVNVTFEKNLPTPKGLAEHEGGYVDQISGKPVIWSPRGRYLIPMGDRAAVHIPASRQAVAHWIRSLGQAPQPLPDYLKKAAERALDGTAFTVAVDMADTISPVQAAEKLATLKSVADAQIKPDALGKLLGDLHGITFSVTVKDQFMGELKLDFGAAPTLLSVAGRDLVVEALARRGLLLAEMRDWKAAVDGKSFVLSGPLDAISVVNLLAFFKGTPSSGDVHHEGSSAAANESSASDGTAKMAKASQRYFAGVQRILGECRNTKGLSMAERGVFNDKLSRKIDQLPLLNVDPELLDYAANVAQLIRGAGLAIRSANVAAGGQKATQASSSRSVGYFGSSFSFNDNTAYNESLEQQAHADGMQAHLTNMQQVDTMTADIRRKMTEKYMVEFQ